MTQTSAPASCALRASGLRRAQKEKSSATRNKIFQGVSFGTHTSKGTFTHAGAPCDPLASASTSALSMLSLQLSFGRTGNAAIEKAMLAGGSHCCGGWLAVLVPPGLKHQNRPEMVLPGAHSGEMLGPFLSNEGGLKEAPFPNPPLLP